MKSFTFNALVGKFAGIFLFLSCLAPVFGQTPLDVKRARAEFRNERQFYRIIEFFSEGERTGRDVIVRTHHEERGGYYFTVRLSSYPYHSEVVEEAVRLQIIMPGDVEPTVFTFPLGPAKKRNPLLLIGLTGEDWPDPGALPLAWHLGFHDAEGNLLAETQSFLWSIEPDFGN